MNYSGISNRQIWPVRTFFFFFNMIGGVRCVLRIKINDNNNESRISLSAPPLGSTVQKNSNCISQQNQHPTHSLILPKPQTKIIGKLQTFTTKSQKSTKACQSSPCNRENVEKNFYSQVGERKEHIKWKMLRHK